MTGLIIAAVVTASALGIALLVRDYLNCRDAMAPHRKGKR